MKDLDAQELFGSLSNKVVEVMAATPQQLVVDSAEKVGLTKVSEAFKAMEIMVEKADPLGLKGTSEQLGQESTSSTDVKIAPSWNHAWPTASWASFGSSESETIQPSDAPALANTANAERTKALDANVVRLQQKLDVRRISFHRCRNIARPSCRLHMHAFCTMYSLNISNIAEK